MSRLYFFSSFINASRFFVFFFWYWQQQQLLFLLNFFFSLKYLWRHTFSIISYMRLKHTHNHTQLVKPKILYHSLGTMCHKQQIVLKVFIFMFPFNASSDDEVDGRCFYFLLVLLSFGPPHYPKGCHHHFVISLLH